MGVLLIRYRDVEKNLDMQLTISMENNHPILPLLEKEMPVIPLDSYTSSEGTFIDLLICGKVANQLSGVLSSFAPTRIGECEVVRLRAEELQSASAITIELSGIPYAARAGLYLRDKQIFIDYRFHHSEAGKVSGIVKKIVGMHNKITIADLGPTSGGIEHLRMVDSRISLSVVGYDVVGPQDPLFNEDQDIYLEFNFIGPDEKGFRAIAYRQMDDGAKPEIRYINLPFLRDAWKLATFKRIPRALIVGKSVDRRFRAYIFLPTSMVSEQLSVLFEAGVMHPEAKLRIDSVRSYTPEIWEWI